MRLRPRFSPTIYRWKPAVLAGLALLFALAGASEAQPFGIWLTFSGPTSGYVQVPSAAALNPTSALTIEAWVQVTDANGGNCSSIVGKNYTQSWWVGICGTTLRSYLKGGLASQRNGGVIPAGEWTHIAVVYDGVNRLHYVNGELVGTFAETGSLPASADPLRIGSDTQWAHTPAGAIDEVRLWNVARSQAELRASINGLTGSTTGLVALWSLNGNANDPAGGHNGVLGGSGVHYFTFPAILSCGSSSSSELCLDGRFLVTAKFRAGAPGTAESPATTAACSNPGSGLFWFFSSDNWEVMVKVIDACSLNDRYWVFTAATTNVFYRLEVLDVRAGVNKIYFNYPGNPAPAVTDTNAFATCP